MQAIRIVSTGEIIAVEHCSFWSNGKQCVHHEQDGYDDEYKFNDIVYNEGDWEFIEVPIHSESISWEEHQANELKQHRVQQYVILNFVYDGTYKAIFDIDKFVKAYNKITKSPTHNLHFVDTEGMRFLSSVRAKYRNQAQTFNCINEFELEPYGFKTEDLINQCLYEVDYDVKRKKFYDHCFANDIWGS